MITSIWGQKIGMTQVFSLDKGKGIVQSIPVTVIDCSGWIVIGFKRFASDSYDAIKVGLIRPKYRAVPFQHEWIANSKKYFSFVREILLSKSFDYQIGSILSVAECFTIGQSIDAVGLSKGLGFAGVYKRHGFGGAAKSHGSMMGRRPGSIGFTRSSGEVMRGQKMAGHKGVQRTTIQNLSVVAIEPEKNILLIKGSVPGKAKAIILVKKSIKG